MPTNYDSVTYAEVSRHGIEKAEIPICITEEALADVIETVGALPPEAGAKCFGPKDRQGIDAVEYDPVGSRFASGAVYSPNVNFGQRRVNFWLNQPEDAARVWTGDMHSHAVGGLPSPKVGQALGDLGYVEAVFEMNEWMRYFAFPIITNTGGNGRVVKIWPWIGDRMQPGKVLYADLIVCPVSQFPQRVFNPLWAPVEVEEQDQDAMQEGHTVGDEAASEKVIEVPVSFQGDETSMPAGEAAETSGENGRDPSSIQWSRNWGSALYGLELTVQESHNERRVEVIVKRPSSQAAVCATHRRNNFDKELS